MNSMTDEELVRRIADFLMAEVDEQGNEPSTAELQLFFDIFCFDMEIGSGASYEQYFRWSSKEQIDRLLVQLNQLGLGEIVDSTREAIEVAFPHGVPANEDDFEDCLDWTEDQEEALEALYEQEVNIHPLVEEKLAVYARSHNLLAQLS